MSVGQVNAAGNVDSGSKLSVGGKEGKKERVSRVEKFICGGVSGVTAKTVVAPLERVKLLNQLGTSKGLLNSLRSIAQHEGLRGFWVGNFTNCLRVFPSSGILFLSNDLLLAALQQHFRPTRSVVSDAWLSMLAGSLAGSLAVIGTYPMDMARTRMAGNIHLKGERSKNLLEVLASSFRQEGPWSWYRGMSTTLMGALPFQGIKFGVYGVLSKHTRKQSKSQPVDPLEKLFHGACAGLVAQTCMFPNDTVRRRLQLQGMGGAPNLYRGALHCYRTLYKEGGVIIFYRGLWANLLRAVPNSAIQFATFDVCKDLLNRWTNDSIQQK